MKKCLLLIAGMAVSQAAVADWGTSMDNPVSVFPTGTSSYATEVKSASDGSVWAMIYHPNTRDAESEMDIQNVVYEYRLQHFDAQGNPEFEEDGILLSDYSNASYTVVNNYMLVDHDDNVVVAVRDRRNSSAGEFSYTAYKVSPEGKMLWGEDGVAISDPLKPSYFSAFMTMTELEDGSYIFAWMEQPATTGGSYIHMQRLSSDGKILWDESKVSMTDEITGYPYLVNSGDNTFILVYGRTSSVILYARKIDFEGESVWGKDVRIYRGGWGQTPVQTQLSVAGDGQGGVIVSWTDDRSGSNVESAYISHVTSEGKLAFAGASDEGDVKLSYDGWRCFNVATVPAADGSAFYSIWRRTDRDQRYQGIMIQKVSPTGELLWGDEAKELFPSVITSLGYVSIQQAGEDGACGFFEEYRSYFDQQCYAHRFDKNGNSAWEAGRISLSRPERMATGLQSQPFGTEDAWLCTWADGGTGENDKATTYLMTRLNEDGTFGIPGSGIEETVSAGSGLSFDGSSIHGNDGASASVYLPEGTFVAGYVLSGGSARVELPAGIYIATSEGKSIKFTVK